MALLRSDLPLGEDPSGRFLPWIVGLMVYLSALALAGAMATDRLAQRWNLGLAGSLTVQLPPPEDPAAREERIDRVLAVLTAAPGIAGAEVLDEAQMQRLLEPWLGPFGADLQLPIPDLVAVTLLPAPAVDLADLRARLSAAVPGALVDDHRAWLDSVADLARSVRLFAVTIVALVSAAAVATVVFATRTGLAIHHRVVELLHLVGARDSYVARQFQAQALRLGLLGGTLGVALAVVSLLAVGGILGRLDRLLLPTLQLEPLQWLVIALLPAAAGLIATMTARFTVLGTLGRRL